MKLCEQARSCSCSSLTLPLALYGIPYAYAATSTSSYQVHNFVTIPNDSTIHEVDAVCNSGDYAVGGGYNTAVGNLNEVVLGAIPTSGAAHSISGTPDRWTALVRNSGAVSDEIDVAVVCQTPVTIAGIGVPEFGQLYVAIALGALVYFLLARRHALPKVAVVTPGEVTT